MQAVAGQKLNIKKLSSRFIIYVLTPLTAIAGVLIFSGRQFYLISIVLAVYSMVPFFLRFERRTPQAREVVIIAVMVAIAAASRAAFFLTPSFKPVGAIVIITGVCFGAESGFLTGALAAFVSNFYFGQGPWTPWQMLAFGLMGLIAGLLFAPGRLPRKTVLLCVFGGLSTYFVYSVILNVAGLFLFIGEPTWESLLLYFTTSFAFDMTHVVANVFFLLALSVPMIKKLTRMQVKFGLMR